MKFRVELHKTTYGGSYSRELGVFENCKSIIEVISMVDKMHPNTIDTQDKPCDVSKALKLKDESVYVVRGMWCPEWIYFYKL